MHPPTMLYPPAASETRARAGVRPSHLGLGRAEQSRADPPFDVSRLDGGGARLYTFLLPVQSVPRA